MLLESLVTILKVRFYIHRATYSFGTFVEMAKQTPLCEKFGVPDTRRRRSKEAGSEKTDYGEDSAKHLNLCPRYMQRIMKEPGLQKGMMEAFFSCVTKPDEVPKLSKEFVSAFTAALLHKSFEDELDGDTSLLPEFLTK